MTPHFDPNGLAWVEVRSAYGSARMVKDGTAPIPARITAKRVVAGLRTYDRATGNNVDRFAGSAYVCRLLAYQLNGRQRQEVTR